LVLFFGDWRLEQFFQFRSRSDTTGDMGMLRIILLLCRVASIVFGMLAVYYWFRASTVTITDADKRYDPKLDLVLNDPDHKADDINFFATA
jgi:hypothetical protein